MVTTVDHCPLNLIAIIVFIRVDMVTLKKPSRLHLMISQKDGVDRVIGLSSKILGILSLTFWASCI